MERKPSNDKNGGASRDEGTEANILEVCFNCAISVVLEGSEIELCAYRGPVQNRTE